MVQKGMDKLFSNNLSFYIILGCIYVGCFLVVDEVTTAFKALKTKTNQIEQEVEEVRTKYDRHLTIGDLVRLCEDTERHNPGFKCPPLEEYKD